MKLELGHEKHAEKRGIEGKWKEEGYSRRWAFC
jgi:hypothetical protein